MLKKGDTIEIINTKLSFYGKVCVIIKVGKKPRTKDTLQYEVQDEDSRYYLLKEDIKKYVPKDNILK